jgi:PqqD family protein of HPr-rel-A system
MCLGDETVAFHEAAGSTHLFDEVTYRLVESLRQSSCSLTSADLWHAAFGAAPSGLDCQALEERLDTLLQAGLVTATYS